MSSRFSLIMCLFLLVFLGVLHLPLLLFATYFETVFLHIFVFYSHSHIFCAVSCFMSVLQVTPGNGHVKVFLHFLRSRLIVIHHFHLVHLFFEFLTHQRVAQSLLDIDVAPSFCCARGI